MLHLQRILYAANGLLLLAAIAAFALTVYAYIHAYVFFDSSPLMKRIFITLFVLEVTVGIGAVFGIVTRNMKKKSMTVLNMVGGVLFLVGFVGIGIGSHYVPEIVLGNGSCNNSDTLWIAAAKKAYSLNWMFCLAPYCHCDMTNYKDYNQTEMDTLDVVRPYRNANNQYYHILQCLPFIIALGNDNYTLVLSSELSAIQEYFSCSGWCEYTDFSLIYIFSNVNNGKPRRACFPTIQDYTHALVRVGGAFAYSIGLLLFVILMVKCFVAIQTSRRGGYLQTSYGFFEEERSGGLYRSRQGADLG